MKKILIIEDDTITANVYSNRFRVDGFQVEVASDGEAGLAAARSFAPDVITCDLMMPKRNGVEVIKAIRADPTTSSIPVIVFSNSYLSTMIKDAWAAGATKCLSKADCTPKHLLEIIQNLFLTQASAVVPESPEVDGQTETQIQAHLQTRIQARPQAVAGATAFVSRPVGAPQSTTQFMRSGGAAPGSSPADKGDAEVMMQALLRNNFFENTPKEMTVFRAIMSTLGKSEDLAARPQAMTDLARRMKTLASAAGMLSFRTFATLTSAMEAFARELTEKPEQINTSSLRTLVQAVDFLPTLLEKCRLPEATTNLSPYILVVDDEPVSRRALATALGRADLRCIQVDDPAIALRLVEHNRFDLIFTDVDMPGMSGFELCSKIRTLPDAAQTPVIFVTSSTDFSSRAKSTLSGGSDFIGKPFLFMEVAVKALTHHLRAMDAGAAR
jgi:CheY-like chemotaxis protein